MAAADHGGPVPDLYQLLGVPRGASREEMALAWRRRARAEHPDARPADATAPGRFRALAEAWRVLGDPARRAAYDRALARERQPAARVPAAPGRVPVRRMADPGGPGGMTPMVREPGPPLRVGPVQVGPVQVGPVRVGPVRVGPVRVGPVRVEGPRQASPPAGWDEQDIRLAVLAELAQRYLAAGYLAAGRGRPW
jgi:DnaJ domain